jgi:DNA-binding MarR family transcriptional regulator
MNYDHLKLENQLCFPFYAVSRLIIRAYQEDLDAIGITYPQYLVLMVLWEKDEQSVVEIADKLILNTNTITPLLKRMEVMQLIFRTPSKTDQRKVVVSLTDEGKLLREKASCIPYNLVNKLNLSPTPENMAETMKMKEQLNQMIQLLKSTLKGHPSENML